MLTGLVFLQLSITMKKHKLFKEKKSKYKTGINYNEENKLFKVQNRYQLEWRKICYSKKKNSKYKTGINYNEEIKLFKVQNRYQLQWRK